MYRGQYDVLNQPGSVQGYDARYSPVTAAKNSQPSGLLGPPPISPYRHPQPHPHPQQQPPPIVGNLFDSGYLNQPVTAKMDPPSPMLPRLPPPASILPMYQPILPPSPPYPFPSGGYAATPPTASMNVTEEMEQSHSNSVIAARFRTKLCRTFEEKGFCPYEEKCMFAHGEAQRRTTEQNMQEGIVSSDAISAYQERERLALVKAKLAQVSQRPPAILSASIRLGDREVGQLDAQIVFPNNGPAGECAPRVTLDAGPKSEVPTIHFPLLLRRRNTSGNVTIEPSTILPSSAEPAVDRSTSQNPTPVADMSLEGPRISDSPSGFINSQPGSGSGVHSVTPTATSNNALGDSLSAFESPGVTPSVSGCQQRSSASGSATNACLAQPMTPPPNQIPAAGGAKETTELPQRGTPPQASGPTQLLRGPSAAGSGSSPAAAHRAGGVHNPYLWRAV